MTKSDAHPGSIAARYCNPLAGFGAGALASSYPLQCAPPPGSPRW